MRVAEFGLLVAQCIERLNTAVLQCCSHQSYIHAEREPDVLENINKTILANGNCSSRTVERINNFLTSSISAFRIFRCCSNCSNCSISICDLMINNFLEIVTVNIADCGGIMDHSKRELHWSCGSYMQ